MRQILCDVFVPSVDILINSLTVTRNAQFIIALRKSVPERVADEDIEKTFDELMKLVQSMDQEEQRYVREGFSSDEELSLYDTIPQPPAAESDVLFSEKVLL